jgi:hypothetical protein
MRTVEKIIDKLHDSKKPSGGVYIKVENEPYMPLVIESIGKSPEGRELISVAHYYTQSGDLCQDPEMVFEVSPEGWRPVYFQMAIPPIFRRAISYEPGGVQVHHRCMLDQLAFSKQWDKNIKHQGFLARAEEMAKEAERATA